jgi:hypothetical protein
MKKNKKNFIIIGGGFSAFIAKILIGNLTKTYSMIDSSNLYKFNLNREKAIEINKFFSKKIKAYSVLKVNLKGIELHAHQKIGGNSNLWGGFLNIRYIPSWFTDLLKKNGVYIKKLSSKNSGSFSNIKEIIQLQTETGNILNITKCIGSYSNYYLHSFSSEGGRLKLKLFSQNNPSEVKFNFTNRLILAVGVFDLIDLLYRSNFISDNDSLKLSEFYYTKPELKFKFISSSFPKTDDAIIRYDLIRAACHFYGIQYKPWLSNLFDKLPIVFEQRFTSYKHTSKFRICDGKLINEFTKREKNIKLIFGSSIHYCNLKINDIDINIFLKNINSKILGLGMAFISQKRPGPISNDIAIDAIKKLEGFGNN